MSRSRWKASTNSSLEIGWISTADIFVLLCCFLFIGAIASRRAREQPTEALDTGRSVATQLEMEADNLRLQLEHLELADKQSKAELLEVKKQLGTLELQSQKQLQSLATRDTQVNTLKRDLAKKEEAARIAASEVEALKNTASDLLPRAQKRLNNQLLGLGGDLRRVVIIVDISNSMQGTSYQGKSYWDLTTGMINRWVNSLDVEEASLIFFGNDARIALPMGKLDDAHRQSISRITTASRPEDSLTNFLAAFRLAFTIDEIDTIIVFSDGLPSVDINGKEIVGPGGKRRDESENAYRLRIDQTVKANVAKVLTVHREIVELVRSHPKVAVNAVGLGEKVYSPHTGNLLNELALRTGGVFIAVPGEQK